MLSSSNGGLKGSVRPSHRFTRAGRIVCLLYSLIALLGVAIITGLVQLPTEVYFAISPGSLNTGHESIPYPSHVQISPSSPDSSLVMSDSDVSIGEAGAASGLDRTSDTASTDVDDRLLASNFRLLDSPVPPAADRESIIVVPHEVKNHSFKIGTEMYLNVDTLPSSSGSKDGAHKLRVQSNIPCSMMNSLPLIKDDRCQMFNIPATHADYIDNPVPIRRTWENCTVFGSASILDSEHFNVENSAVFLINRHNVDEFVTWGHNIERYMILHYVHWSNEPPGGDNSTYFVVSLAGHVPAVLKKNMQMLNCNSYSHISLLKTFLSSTVQMESYSGTNVVFGLLPKCRRIHVIGMFDPGNPDIKYGYDPKEHGYGGNRYDYDLMLLLHSCDMIKLHYYD